MIAVAQEDNSRAKGCVMNWGVTAAWTFNTPAGDVADDRYNSASDEDSLSEQGGLLGGNVRFSWQRGWWISAGLNVGYNSCKVIPADESLPLMGMNRWSMSLPVTGGWYYTTDFKELGIGPVAGVEFIGNLSTRCRGLERIYHVSSSRMWRPVNVAALVGVEWGVPTMRVELLLHWGLLSMADSNYRDIIAGGNPPYVQFSVAAKFLF